MQKSIILFITVIVCSINCHSQKTNDTSIAFLKKNTIDTLLNFNQYEKIIKQFEAAKRVLKYVDTRGFVLNKNIAKFNKAVMAYRKLNNDKLKKDSMQVLDILIRDKNRKAIGWVAQ